MARNTKTQNQSPVGLSELIEDAAHEDAAALALAQAEAEETARKERADLLATAKAKAAEAEAARLAKAEAEAEAAQAEAAQAEADEREAARAAFRAHKANEARIAAEAASDTPESKDSEIVTTPEASLWLPGGSFVPHIVGERVKDALADVGRMRLPVQSGAVKISGSAKTGATIWEGVQLRAALNEREKSAVALAKAAASFASALRSYAKAAPKKAIEG